MTLRLGDLESQVEERAGGGPLGSVVRRDLARYYRAVRDTHLYLLVDDADLVVHALKNFDATSYQFIWAQVDEYLERRNFVQKQMGIPSRHVRIDRESMKVQLRVGGLFKRMAIVDAVERYWIKLQALGVHPVVRGQEGRVLFDPEYPVTDPELETMVEVGLIGRHQANEYREKRDDPGRVPTLPPAVPSPALEGPRRMPAKKPRPK